MSITSSLTDFSLPEIFQFLEKGHKTGLLALTASPEDRTTPSDIHYIWLYQGRIVGAANQLDHQGLVGLIAQNQGISKRVVAKLVQLCPTDKPLGVSLKHQCVLSTQQLKRLFQIQVLQRVCALFELKDGLFKFIQNAPIPTREMTGLTISTTEATLLGLRMLRNWDALVDKLPDPNAGLAHIIVGQPPYRLNTIELQVWERAQGTVSLKAIAKELKLPIEKVQQVAFALMTVSIVEEVPLLAGILPTQVVEPLPTQLTEDSTPNINSSFLHNLVGFLRSKTGGSSQLGLGYASDNQAQNLDKSIDRLIDTLSY
ncbi:MAG TPA: hypothetical protein DDZ80_25390 [Cyanobacteria bacterium UBA8803]|nr:hypothetical protein [Cyanobacteria bacterium UBA9273]HBL61629.1 hypothetical protein [Cyanobacteria bacterium UBA8803]